MNKITIYKFSTFRMNCHIQFISFLSVLIKREQNFLGAFVCNRAITRNTTNWFERNQTTNWHESKSFLNGGIFDCNRNWFIDFFLFVNRCIKKYPSDIEFFIFQRLLNILIFSVFKLFVSLWNICQKLIDV